MRSLRRARDLGTEDEDGVTSRVVSLRDPLVSEGKEKKEGWGRLSSRAELLGRCSRARWEKEVGWPR